MPADVSVIEFEFELILEQKGWRFELSVTAGSCFLTVFVTIVIISVWLLAVCQVHPVTVRESYDREFYRLGLGLGSI